MSIDDQRTLAIKILTSRKSKINLQYEYSDYVIDQQDVIDISVFLEEYITKYESSFLSIDSKLGEISLVNPDLVGSIIENIKKLTASEFEKLSGLLCKCLNYTEYFSTPVSHDQGIDFLGYSVLYREFYKESFNIREYILGQSKHYKKGLVDTKEIRELVGSIDLFKIGNFTNKKIKKAYSKINLNHYSPITIAFTSNYFFSNDAHELCNQTPIIHLDLIDLMFIFLKSLDKRTIDWLSPKRNFSRAKFKNDIKNVAVIN